MNTAVAVAIVPLPPPVLCCPVESEEVDAEKGLPSPSAEAAEPTDLLGLMMAIMTNMSMQSVKESQFDIQVNQEKISKALDNLTTKLREALEKAEQAKEEKDDGGFFGFISDCWDAVTDFVGDVLGDFVGTIADFAVDTVMTPIDLTMGLLQGKNIEDLMREEFDDLTTNGDVANTCKEAVKGVVKFVGDLVQFAYSAIAVIEAGVKGKDLLDAMGAQLESLWQSCKDNIIDNEGLMEVVGVALKAVAIAATAASGGALAVVAIGLFVLSEMNHRYGVVDGVCDKLGVDKDVAKYINVGIDVAATVMLAWAGGGGLEKMGNLGDTLSAVQTGAALLGGGIAVYKGVNHIIEGDRQADQLERQAALREALNQLSELQRLMDELIKTLETKTENRSSTMKDASQVYQIHGETQLALAVRA